MNGESINTHYGRAGLSDLIFEALRQTGRDVENLSAEDLTPVDHFHTRGLAATEELAERAGIEKGAEVLDVGGGIGGAARFLARQFGCRVTVLDLTEEYCAAGELLTARTGLGKLVEFRCGNALEMPFPKESFDLVWTQHSSMNIADKPALYAEIHRVLRPGGRFALHEIMGGENGPVYFPVPWATEGSDSFLKKPEMVRDMIKEAGFGEIDWRDETALAVEWFQRSPKTEPPPLGLHLLLGENFSEMFRNQVRNLNENRVTVIQGIFEKQ